MRMAPIMVRFLAQTKRPWLGGAFVALAIIWASMWLFERSPVTRFVIQDVSNYTYSTSIDNRPQIHNQTDKPLILYAFFESQNARVNLQFFIKHALHDAADFIFIFNGKTNAMSLLPNATNVNFIHRPNECYDMGAYAAVLVKDDFYKQYKRFIMMNASIRGPFIPYWSNGCWSDMYLNKVTDSVKLVGMTINCIPLNHIQTMILATDSIGIETLLYPSNQTVQRFRDSLPPFPYMKLPKDHPALEIPPIEHPGINSCPNDYWQAVSVEVHTSQLIKAAGYKIDAMMAAFHSSPTYEDDCEGNIESPDVLYEDSYYGTNLHPFDTVFAKSNRGTNEKVLRKLTDWTDGREYSSYDFCLL